MAGRQNWLRFVQEKERIRRRRTPRPGLENAGVSPAAESKVCFARNGEEHRGRWSEAEELARWRRQECWPEQRRTIPLDRALRAVDVFRKSHPRNLRQHCGN